MMPLMLLKMVRNAIAETTFGRSDQLTLDIADSLVLPGRVFQQMIMKLIQQYQRITKTLDVKGDIKFSLSNGRIEQYSHQQYACFQSQRYYAERCLERKPFRFIFISMRTLKEQPSGHRQVCLTDFRVSSRAYS